MGGKLRQHIASQYCVSWLERFIFSRVLLPAHPLVDVPFVNLAHTLAEIRGHALKMPISVLTYHLFMKAYRGVVEGVLGKHIFTEATPLPTTNKRSPN